MKTRRIFHIWDLPTHLIWIDLEDNFRKELINKARLTAGSIAKLAQYLRIKEHNIFLWKRGRSYWKGKTIRRSIPLNYTLKMCSLINDYKFSKIELEKRVLVFKGPGNGRLIKTRFPWYEDERIIRILFHMLGDGFGSAFGNYNQKGKTTGLPYYRNTREELRSEFKEDLKFFGEVPTNLNIDMLCFPKVISYILKHLYKIDFGTYSGKIPDITFKLPKYMVAQGIKAFADDEGCMDDCRIKFFSFNKGMLSQLKSLIIKKFPEIGEESINNLSPYKSTLRNKEYTGYKFSIKSNGLEAYYKQIGFLHKRKKKLLENWIERKNRKWNRRNKDITKLLILKSLIEKPKISREISNEVGITATNIMTHMKGNNRGIKNLEEDKLVKNIGLTKHRGNIWAITGKGLKFFKNKFNGKLESLVHGNTDLYYLQIIYNLKNKHHKEICPKILRLKIKKSLDWTQKILFRLYKKNYLNRHRSKNIFEEFKYNLTEKGESLLKQHLTNI